MGDIQVVYENDQVYVDYGSIKLKCSVDEINEVIQPLLAEIVIGNSSSASFTENQKVELKRLNRNCLLKIQQVMVGSQQ